MSKAELRKTLRETLEGALGKIDAAVVSIDAETTDFLRRVGVFEVQAGIGLAVVKATMAQAKSEKITFAKAKGIGTDDWRVIARDRVPGKDVKTLYRWQNAGAVALVLGDAVGSALVGSLVPLYRILSALPSKATDEDRAAAEDLVRTAWTEALEGAEDGVPTESEVKAIAERLAPTTRSGGSETSVSDDTTDEDDEDDDEDDEDEGAETRRESSDSLVVVEAAAVEAAAGPTDAILRGIGRDLVGKPLTDEGVKAIALAVLRLAGEHGVGTIVAVLAGKGAAAPETTDAAA